MWPTWGKGKGEREKGKEERRKEKGGKRKGKGGNRVKIGADLRKEEERRKEERKTPSPDVAICSNDFCPTYSNFLHMVRHLAIQTVKWTNSSNHSVLLMGMD